MKSAFGAIWGLGIRFFVADGDEKIITHYEFKTAESL